MINYTRLSIKFSTMPTFLAVILSLFYCKPLKSVLFAEGLSTEAPVQVQARTLKTKPSECFVVVGKIIIDEYKDPKSKNDDAVVSVGGGGPQAAWGAAAALAVIEQMEYTKTSDDSKPLLSAQQLGQDLPFPPPQPVAFLGPVGQMSSTEKKSLYSMLQPAVKCICTVEELKFQTPRIQLWHDEAQDLKWFPLQDSWGYKGADGLWRNRPSAVDIFEAARSLIGITKEDEADISSNIRIDSLFVIMEAGEDSPGGGEDSFMLSSHLLREQTRIIGIEPIAFPDELTGKVTARDAISFQKRLERYQTVDVITPDRYLFEAVDLSFWKNYLVTARYGEEGSKVLEKTIEHPTTVPIATLQTPNGEVVNPTGAGNAYSSAITACLGKGLSLLEASCIASAVGAAVCEHQNLPPWSWETIKRIETGATEIRHKLWKIPQPRRS